jgi:hypothetical protein
VLRLLQIIKTLRQLKDLGPNWGRQLMMTRGALRNIEMLTAETNSDDRAAGSAGNTEAV